MIFRQSRAVAAVLEELELERGRSLWSEAWARFRGNKAALASCWALGALIVFIIIGPFFAQYSNEEIDWNILGNIAEQGAPSFENGHYFGVDELGRDLYARVLQGSQISLLVGILGAAVVTIIGTAFGMLAAFLGGKFDLLLMRVVDIMLALPIVFVYILLFVVFGRSIVMLFFGIALFSWSSTAMIVRAQTLSVLKKEYVEAARALGLSNWTIAWRHVFPNILGVLAVYAAVSVPDLILAESTISFLGLGVQEPNTSWGALIAEGATTISYGTTWQIIFPMLFFGLAQLSMLFIADGLRDALDPKDR